MVRDDLTMEKGQKEVHYANVNIYTSVDGHKIAAITTTIQADSKENLEAKIATIPDKVKGQYENPSIVSVEVKEGSKHSMTRAEFEDYVRRDSAEIEEQIYKWFS